MKVESILADEQVLKAIDQAESEEEFRSILTSKGATEAEINGFIEQLRNTSEEIFEADLEAVAGGGNPILQRYLCKWGYRLQHGKWFVKTTYDENTKTITATNRFGKEKVSETYSC